MCSVRSWLMKRNSSPRRCSTFCSEPVSRLSTQMTRKSRAIRWSQRWEPRNPAPPVTTAVGIGRMLAARPDRDGVAEDAQDDLRDPESEAAHRHHESEEVEEHERVEVADDVLLAHPPEEALDEQPRDRRHDLAQPDTRSFADAVDRPRR